MIGWNSTDEESRPHPWLPHRSRFLELVTGHIACPPWRVTRLRSRSLLGAKARHFSCAVGAECESMEQAGARDGGRIGGSQRPEDRSQEL